ncbi:semaphorin-6C isoform X2 [Falco rusticolus]|uniref:semaphorin-6C isoform X2 n=1 Tax=Falco rusticolus TaxID=120794 RepID=UPI001886660D|nr:semaphorin-6C isoform X2 [Falco rusticolus]
MGILGHWEGGTGSTGTGVLGTLGWARWGRVTGGTGTGIPGHWEGGTGRTGRGRWEHCPHSGGCPQGCSVPPPPVPQFPVPRPAPGSPGGPVPVAMLGVPLPFILLLLLAGGAAQSFPRDLVPRSTVGLAATAAYPRFGGLGGANGTAQLGLDFQRMLRLNGTLFVAARDHIYAFNLGQDKGMLYPERYLTWESRDRENCAMRGRLQDECHNYIRVLVPRDAGTLLACGTNAFSPLCRTYQVSSLAQEGEEVSGQARCPFDAKQSIVALFVDGSLYSATVADFQASDAVIYRSLSPGRPPLRTLKYSSRWLQEPHFVQALPYGPYVYFFFREVAVELSALGKVAVARVARVCRNDRGGSPRVLERRWTSFLKVRLQCAVPGDAIFYFDVLEAVTPPRALHGRPAVLALFGTQPNSIPGSAVCAFYLADVERAFEGPFAEPRGASSTWMPVPEDRVPRPRPGCCAGMGPAAGIVTSGDFPDETLAFAKEHPLLHGAVAPAGGRPLFTRTGTRLTQLAVDTGAGPRGNQTVLFLGAEDGRVLKVLAATQHPGATQHPSGTPAPGDSQEPGDTGDATSETLLLEEISLYDPRRCQGPRGASRVLGLELHPPGQELYVAFAGCLVRLPLSRCARHGACRRSCLAARDPYCVWLPRQGCVPFSEDLPNGFKQDVEGYPGTAGTCQDAPAVGDSDGDRDLAHGRGWGPAGPPRAAHAGGHPTATCQGTLGAGDGAPAQPGRPPRHPRVPGAPRARTPAQGHPGRDAAAAARDGGLGVAGDPPGHQLLRQPGAAGHPVLQPRPGPPRRDAPPAGRAPRQPPAAPAAPGTETLARGDACETTWPGPRAHPHALAGDPGGASLGPPARHPGALPLHEAPCAAQAPDGASSPRAALSPPAPMGHPCCGWRGAPQPSPGWQDPRLPGGTRVPPSPDWPPPG